MASKNFLLVSLEESKAKELAQIVSNDVCRKILDYLTAKEKGATETEIAKDLQIPLSTAHYNLKQLLQSGIVKAEEFHYSEKGREVLHYSLANRYIIIAPKATATESLANKLKRILPVAAFVAAAGFVVQLYDTFTKAGAMQTSYSIQKASDAAAPVMQEAASTGQREFARAAANATNETAMAVEKVVTQVVPAEHNITLWFLMGAVFAIAAILLVDALRSKR
ncbi:helix-turn-helix transcriptional regulator [Candidatus Woesearchaeota archaeon]|nr:helix-turn-helix transcriptional regulator [Candidatus Woesearchaeota archaeon]